MADSILVFGTSQTEISFNLFRVPEKGETVVDDGGVAYLPGGSAPALCEAFAKLGDPVSVASKLGADLHGRRLFDYYNSIGTDTSVLKVDHDLPTGTRLHLKEADGSVRCVLYPGANANLTTENVYAAFHGSPRAVVPDFSLPFGTVLTAAKIAVGKSIPLFLCPTADNRDAALELLPDAEAVLLDADAAEAFTGIRPTASDSSLRAGLALYKRFKCRYLVISLGERGAFLYDGKHYQMASAPSTPGKRPEGFSSDATVAYKAAFIHEYLRTGDLRTSADFAAAAATITVQNSTALPYFATDEEVRAASGIRP